MSDNLTLPSLAQNYEYNPSTCEPLIRSFWEKHDLHRAGQDPQHTKEKFSMVMPPPNVTGILHLGHVWDNTIPDILVRFKKMQGYDALYVPGADHAGIATQHVVERELRKQGLTKEKLGREKFLEKVWEWKESSEKTIISQLKKIGVLCDWSRYAFTMDEPRSKAVREAFCQLYDKGLVYRGEYLVNWCPSCGTALSDDEVEYQEEQGTLYYLRYPLEDNSGFVTIATTRPETILADVAVAFHPDDTRYVSLQGKKVRLPIVGRLLDVVADKFVDPSFGTGLVKITPGHDANDFLVGQRHNLPILSVLNERGIMNEKAGKDYEGLDRMACREKIVSHLTGYCLDHVEEHPHKIGHCYRCETVIEPMISKQWFVRMAPLAKMAKEAVEKGEIKIHPEKWSANYFNWLDNIRDWCISRQIWWGHRIPAWTCNVCHELTVLSRENPPCKHCENREMAQDPDVLDTWFSSWLWPMSVFGWPEGTDDFKKFYPTSVLSSGKDILFFWDVRMIMAGLFFTGRPPFKDLYLHGLARDKQGRKISKSFNNSPDILKIIDQYGADSVRMGIVANAPIGEDCYVSEDIFKFGKHFTNKLWNAARFILVHYKKYVSSHSSPVEREAWALTFDNSLQVEDYWIISHLDNTIVNYTACLERYEFGEAAKILNDFFWHTFCDWYLEWVKERLADPQKAFPVIRVLRYIFCHILKLVHPIQPFVTETLWQLLREAQFFDEEGSILESLWPQSIPELNEPSTKYQVGGFYTSVERIRSIIQTLREVRVSFKASKQERLPVIIKAHKPSVQDQIEKLTYLIDRLEKVEIRKINLGSPSDTDQYVPRPLEDCTIYVDIKDCKNKDIFTGIFNVHKKELEKVGMDLQEIFERLIQKKATLEKMQQSGKAPRDVFEREKGRYESCDKQLRDIIGSVGLSWEESLTFPFPLKLVEVLLSSEQREKLSPEEKFVSVKLAIFPDQKEYRYSFEI